MSYWLHPEAAEEHKKQVAYYHELQAGLGRRYHTEFQNVLASVCASPDRLRIVSAPGIRRAVFKVFHFDLIYREVMNQFKCWQSPFIAASPVIGWLGFNELIDLTFAGYRQRGVCQGSCRLIHAANG